MKHQTVGIVVPEWAKELLDGVTPTSTPTSLIPVNENIKKLIEIIGENQLSVKEMLAGMGLKDRPNFLEYTLSPAMKEEYVRMLYPDSPSSSTTEIPADSQRPGSLQRN